MANNGFWYQELAGPKGREMSVLCEKKLPCKYNKNKQFMYYVPSTRY